MITLQESDQITGSLDIQGVSEEELKNEIELIQSLRILVIW